MVDPEKLAQANQILQVYRSDATLYVNKSVQLKFKCGDIDKRWVPHARGSDYPTIRHLPFGGTNTCMTMELTRWARGMPFRPLGYWAVCVRHGTPARIMDVLAACKWPAQVPCVMCGRLVGGGVSYDFYSHDKCKPGPGPGCWYGEGCQVY